MGVTRPNGSSAATGVAAGAAAEWMVSGGVVNEALVEGTEGPASTRSVAVGAVMHDVEAEWKALGKKIKAINEQARRSKKEADQVSLFKGKYTVLKPNYDRFSQIMTELSELYIRLGKEDEKRMDDSSLISTYERYFYEATSTYLELNAPNQAPASSNNTTSANNDSSFHRTHLPRIPLPQFSGDLSSWPRFRDTYQSLVHTDPRSTPIEKFHFLLSSLSGEALAL
ncbi:hypothetical protein O3M35_000768 [Rhynocoris fuscipes]|uniref:Uncharacterized protein n=1 Tax=Rhynocoris fuscipes TaxID=488301 RepID=A0AAW1DMW6_9HEMI